MSVMLDRHDISLFLLENGADFTKPILFRDSKPIYIQNFLREQRYPLGSEHHTAKMRVVDFLLAKGIDYRNTPIPEEVVDEAQTNYPDTWEEYLKKY
jgi:hypothetical protein